MTIQENIAVSHPQQVYTYVLENFAASQTTAVALFRVATSSSAKIDAVQAVMPWAGSIIGLGIKLSADKTAGVLSFSPTIAGTALALACAITTNTQKGYVKARYGIYRFAAGALLGMCYTSDANMLPDGSADVAADVYVVFDRVDI